MKAYADAGYSAVTHSVCFHLLSAETCMTLVRSCHWFRAVPARVTLATRKRVSHYAVYLHACAIYLLPFAVRLLRTVER